MNTIFQELDSIAYALSWTVLNSLWQFLLVGFLLKILLKIVPTQKSEFRYHLSLATLLFCGLWWISSFANHYIKFQENSKTISLATEVPITTTPTIKEESAVFTPEETNIAITPIETELEAKPWHEATKATIFSFVRTNKIWLFYGWLLGVILLLGRFFGSWWYLKQLRTQHLKPISQKWQDRFEQLKQQLHISKNIQLVMSAVVPEPMTFGHLKPIILLPIGLINNLTPQQVEAILLHELAHIRRNDFLINCLQSWTEIVLFYHPIIWWMNGRIRSIREECCDDLVLAIQQNRHTYAEALLQIQKFSLTTKINLAMSATGKKSNLTERVHRLFKAKHTTIRRRSISLPLLLLFLVISSLSFLAFQTIQKQRPIVSMSADKMNVLYYGVENPLTVAVEGISNEDVQIQSETIDLQKVEEGKYIAMPTTETGKAIITVKTSNLARTLDFEVKKIPDPIVRLGGASFYSNSQSTILSVEQVKQLKGIYPKTFDLFDVECEVISYSVMRVPRRASDIVMRRNKGADFEGKTKELIEEVEAEDTYFIEDIKVKCPGDEAPRMINSLVLKVK